MEVVVENKQRSFPSRKVLWIGLLAFVITAATAVVLHSVTDYGFDTHRSVSRYVGFEFWSAMFFTLGNCIIVASVARFLWKLGELWRMPRLYFYLVFVMGVSLIWLSVCPVGYFDVDGKVSFVSKMHEISSKTMFMTMLLVAVLIAGNPYASRMTHIASAIYVIYGAICIMGYLTEGAWFMPIILITESAYIVSFIIMLMFCKTREHSKESLQEEIKALEVEEKIIS